jgi:two-component system, cell cycle response regulator
MATETLQMREPICRLPVFRPVVVRLMSVLESDDVEITEIAKLIQSDPGLAAEVLILANSPLFGFTSEIRDLRHAVSVLGCERVRSLAMTVALRAYLNVSGRTKATKSCWSHSIACAVIAEQIGSSRIIRNEALYAGGLMHDIGRVGLISAYSDQYSSLFSGVYTSSSEVREAEARAFSVDHCTAGLWLTKAWGFPQEFLDLSSRHHDVPPSCNDDVGIVALSCVLADSLGFEAVTYEERPTAEEVIRRLPEAARRRLSLDFDEIQQRISETLGSLG